MRHVHEPASYLPLEKLLTTVTRLMTCYARAPDDRLATSIALSFERLAATATEDWPLLRLVGKHFSEEWRALSQRTVSVAQEDAPDGCRRVTVAEGEYCKLTRCAGCGAICAHFGPFRLRMPQAAFRSVCETFALAEKRLRIQIAPPSILGESLDAKIRAVH